MSDKDVLMSDKEVLMSDKDVLMSENMFIVHIKLICLIDMSYKCTYELKKFNDLKARRTKNIN